MKTSLYLGALCAIAVASPALAADTDQASAPAAAASPAPKPEKLICKREQSVGTRLSQSICLTRSQWRARDRAEEFNKTDTIDRINRDAATPMPNGSGGG